MIESIADNSGRQLQPKEVVSWQEFNGRRSIFDRLIDISGFTIFADIPPIPEVRDSSFIQRLSTGLYEHVLRTVETAKFYNEDELTLLTEPGRAGVSYNDDRYDFTLGVDDDTIWLRRQGSRLEDFHYWYTAIGPPLSALMAGVLDELKKQTEREFTIFRANFGFNFLLHSLFTEETKRRVRNSELMRKLIRGVPDNSGQLADDEKMFDSAGRIDVNITRWVRNHAGVRRLERYRVEAPANKDGGGLWLSFGYAGETYTSPTSLERSPFRHRQFFSEYAIAYADFLRDKAILSFLAQLLHSVDFRSSAGGLP